MMKLTLQQLRLIIKEEVQKSLLESSKNLIFKPGDLVRTKNPRYEAPIYASQSDGSPDTAHGMISKLSTAEDAKVIEIDVSGEMIKVTTPGGIEGWIIGSFLIPATSETRKAPTGKEFVVTFIGAQGRFRKKTIIAKDISDAEAKAARIAKSGEHVEIDEI